MVDAKVQEVGCGCYAWLRLPGGWGETNIGLVVGDGASLLIDTPFDQRLAREMLTAFEHHVDGAPISTVVNTHSDQDHWWGNAALPRAEIISSAAAARQMRRESSPRELGALLNLAAAFTLVPGRAGRLGRYVSDCFDFVQIEGVTPRFPDRTFTTSTSEIVGGRTVEVLDLGGAHTVSDSVAFVPDARVVFCGDLLFAHVTPITWHGPVSVWTTALETLMGMEADVFVPGHGPVGTRADLEALHSYWTWLSTAVTDLKQAGIGITEMTRRLVNAPEFRAYADWPSPERLYVNVVSIERHLDGKGPVPGTPLHRIRGFDGIACLAHHMEHAR